MLTHAGRSHRHIARSAGSRERARTGPAAAPLAIIKQALRSVLMAWLRQASSPPSWQSRSRSISRASFIIDAGCRADGFILLRHTCKPDLIAPSRAVPVTRRRQAMKPANE